MQILSGWLVADTSQVAQCVIGALGSRGDGHGAVPGATYLSLRRLAFTFRALARALAPSTPIAFPRKLWGKTGCLKGATSTSLEG